MENKLRAVAVIVFCLIRFISSAQVPTGKLSAADQRNLQRVQQAIRFLKAQKTRSFTPFDSASLEGLSREYQPFFNAYFDTAYITDSARKQSIMSGAGQMLLLYNIDHYLDVLPLDSVFIAPLSFFDQEEASRDRHHTLVTYLKIDGTDFLVHALLFNEEGKIKGVAPYIDFEGKREKIDVEGFYNRQKGYDKIKDKIYIF
ncbi:MAG: hypothetical protein JO301_07635 [Chitinophagaceae bacterium]|nr:hypothetical protein [Chitinophagaceae bacterium]